MGNLTRSFAKVGAVLAISSIALVGCSTAEAPAPKDGPTSSSKATESPRSGATAEGAASFANEFLAAVISEKPDQSSFNPPVKLTDAQSEQLVLDGQVDGVSDEDLNSLVDYLYENHPLGRFVYFPEDATVQERLQVISALVLVQSYAGTVTEDKAPEKIVAEDVVVNEDGENPSASFSSSGTELAPTMVFVDDEWKIDGRELLRSLGTATDEAPAESPVEEPAPAPSE